MKTCKSGQHQYDASLRRCPECARAYRERDRERARERARAWYEANRERKREANRERDREANRERCRAYREANRERCRAYREANRERDRAYREANRDRARERARAWYEANRERKRAHSHKRRARKMVNGPYDRMSWHTVAQRDGMYCDECGTLCVVGHADKRRWPSLDHIVPLSRGGTHTLENARLVCFSCNSRKSNSTKRTRRLHA